MRQRKQYTLLSILNHYPQSRIAFDPIRISGETSRAIMLRLAKKAYRLLGDDIDFEQLGAFYDRAVEASKEAN